MRCARNAILPVLSAALAVSAVAAPPPDAGRDDLRALLAALDPNAVFSSHAPRFTYRRQALPTACDARTRRQTLVIYDAGRAVAFMPLAGLEAGTFRLLAHRPGRGPAELLHLPGRASLARRPSVGLRTGALLARDDRDAPDTLHVKHVEGGLMIVRQVDRPGGWSPPGAGRARLTRTVITLLLHTDPASGYVIDAVWELTGEGDAPALPLVDLGPVPVWSGEGGCARLAWTDDHHERLFGVGANLSALRALATPPTCRTGGMMMLINTDDGWSPAVGIHGAPARLRVSDDGSRMLLVSPLPPAGDPNRPARRVLRHRLQAVAPEVSAYAWRTMILHPDHLGRQELRLPLGRLEDFENQPVPLTTPGGLPCDGAISWGRAHSGDKALAFSRPLRLGTDGRIRLRPGTRYRLTGWMCVEPLSPAERQAHRKRLRRIHAPLGIDDIPADALAAIEHSAARLIVELRPPRGCDLRPPRPVQTDPIAPEDGWKQVTVEFQTGPEPTCLELTLDVSGGTARLDDFLLAPVGDEPDEPPADLPIPTSQPASPAQPISEPPPDSTRERRPAPLPITSQTSKAPSNPWPNGSMPGES